MGPLKLQEESVELLEDNFLEDFLRVDSFDHLDDVEFLLESSLGLSKVKVSLVL